MSVHCNEAVMPTPPSNDANGAERLFAAVRRYVRCRVKTGSIWRTLEMTCMTDAVEKSLRTSANYDSARTEDDDLGGGDVFVTPVLADMRRQLEPYYSEVGRPSVDPALMLRMLIVG
jgi:hypothetical protein